jgi:two-component system LytT family response regulator
LISINDIIRIEGDGKYANVYTFKGEKQVASKSISELEDILPIDKFIRVHSTHIVNIAGIEKYLKTRNGSLVLKDGLEIPVSVSYKHVVKERLVL